MKVSWKNKNAVLLLGICAAVSGIFYIVRCYGMAYTDKDVPVKMGFKPVCIFMVLLVLGAGPKWFDFSNNFTNYMGKMLFRYLCITYPGTFSDQLSSGWKGAAIDCSLWY